MTKYLKRDLKEKRAFKAILSLSETPQNFSVKLMNVHVGFLLYLLKYKKYIYIYITATLLPVVKEVLHLTVNQMT